ncbi:MAG: Uncharacterised protein [Alphaproteobacteria bacterium]|nr:MAG: Uncharacterised protein [Alphaproteobacteria bacterium]
MTRLLLLLFMLVPLSARAETLSWLNKIDYLLLEDSHQTSRVWSGHFKALNGDDYNMAHFYAPQKPQFNLRTAFTLSETSRLRLALPCIMTTAIAPHFMRPNPISASALSRNGPLQKIWCSVFICMMDFSLAAGLTNGPAMTVSGGPFTAAADCRGQMPRQY